MRAEKTPRDERDDCGGDDGGNEDGGDFVGETLHGSAATLRFTDQLNDLREGGFAADTFGAHDEAAAGVERAAGEFVAERFFYRHRFAGEHGLVDGAGAIEKFAVDGDTLAGADAETVTEEDLIERDVLFG